MEELKKEIKDFIKKRLNSKECDEHGESGTQSHFIIELRYETLKKFNLDEKNNWEKVANEIDKYFDIYTMVV